MSNPKPALRFTLTALFLLILVLSIAWAVVPYAALTTIGAMPSAIGFIIFVVGDLRDREGLRLLGLTVMGLGLAVGAVLMGIVNSLEH